DIGKVVELVFVCCLENLPTEIVISIAVERLSIAEKSIALVVHPDLATQPASDFLEAVVRIVEQCRCNFPSAFPLLPESALTALKNVPRRLDHLVYVAALRN